MRASAAALAISIAVTWPVLAADPQSLVAKQLDPVALHIAGNYEAAVAAGRAQGDVAGLVASAKSALFLAAYEITDKKQSRAMLASAEADAQRAVDLAPEHIDANLQLAIAQGYRARLTISAGLAKQVRVRAEWILERAPQNPYALATLGSWHGETVATLGGFISRMATGANVGDFQLYFERALSAAPQSPLIIAYYARLLIDLNKKGMRTRAERVLALLDGAVPKDAFETYMFASAKELRAALEANDRRALAAAVKAQLPFKQYKDAQ